MRKRNVVSKTKSQKNQNQRIGLNCALSTPFGTSGEIDLLRMTEHAKWVIANGCHGLTVFGTTGEGASIGIPARYQVLAAMACAGLDMRRQVIAGVSAASVSDCVAQAQAGYDMDCRGLLFAPPFYFSEARDEGLFRFFASAFEKLGGNLRDVILYHIPGMTRNGISIELTQKLMKEFPGVIIGVKDSNGQWPATERRLKELSELQILVGDERQLANAVRHGGSGTICGLANIAPDLLRPLANQGKDDARVGHMVEAILSYSFMSAVKAMIGERLGDKQWSVMSPPLVSLSSTDTRKLAKRLAAVREMKRSI
jgi:4-hydroxy-tetrahydrodipicolinate synthase